MDADMDLIDPNLALVVGWDDHEYHLNDAVVSCLTTE